MFVSALNKEVAVFLWTGGAIALGISDAGLQLVSADDARGLLQFIGFELLSKSKLLILGTVRLRCNWPNGNF